MAPEKAAKKRATKTSSAKRTAKKARPQAKKSKAAGGAQLRIKQTRSEIGHAETYRRTLRALGLRHYQHETVVSDSPATRGQLHKVHHLVRVLDGG